MKKNSYLTSFFINTAFLLFTLTANSNAQTATPKPPTLNQLSKVQVADDPDHPKEQIVEITTKFGIIKVKLYNQTPLHRDNFIKLVGEGFYDNTLFHRVISKFMIQGGDPTSKMAKPDMPLGNGDVGYKIPAEFVDTLYHKRGALAAARDNNPEKESSGCQFYIVQGKPVTAIELSGIEQRSGKHYNKEQKNTYTTLGGTPFLDHDYTVFGEVIEGMDIVDQIASQPTNPGDRPKEDIKMTMKLID